MPPRQRVKPRTKWRYGGALAVSMLGQGEVTAGDDEEPTTDNAEADWESRISGRGVVWYHDFRDDAEVNAFRWTPGYSGGNDPLAKGSGGSRVRRITTDGITGGGCLEIVRPAGSSEGAHWIRPFAPLSAPGNGKDKNDPAAFGTVTVRSWTVSDGSSTAHNFANGWYGHPSYHTSNFDGDEFWLQMRVKRDIRRVTGGNQNFLVGKHLYLAICEGSVGAPTQELVVYSNGGGGEGVNRFRIYGGWAYFEPLDDAPGTDGSIQPGGDPNIWEWNSGSWDTVMYHIKMGREDVSETLIEVYGAHEGETEFTKFWEQTFAYWDFEVRNGLQSLQLSTYNNGFNLPQEYAERWDQIIFSKEYIPCPQPRFPSWYPDQPGTIVEISSGTTIGSAARADGANSFPGTDPDNITAPWSGGAIVYIQGRPYLIVYGGGHGDSAYNGILKFGPLYGEGSDDPQWSVFLPASSTSAVRNASTYADGRQAANHTYNNLEGVFDRLYNLATDAHYSDGSKTDQAFAFTPDGQIDLADHSRAGARGCAAFDPNTRRIYYAFGAGQFQDLQYYDINGDSWGTVSGDDFYFNTYVMGACDTKRGALLFAGENTSGGAQVYYWPSVTSGTKRTGFALPANHAWSIIYDPWRDAFVSMVNGSRTVRELDAAALAAGQTPSWTDRTFSGATPATGHSAGTWGRFRAVPELRGYILVPTSESAVYFYRSV